MKITFIHHSSFCVELEDTVFVFDYFRGERVPEFEFTGEMPEFSTNQKIYVFASHKHQDHFDMEVLKWKEKYPNIQYIFSKDMKFSDKYLEKNNIDLQVKECIRYMKANEILKIDELEIETLASTDEGVAFLVTYAGKTIYHAGDLHWWHWEENEDVINEYQEKTYKRQIDTMKDKIIDIAFVVLDSRLEKSRFWGIDYFMNHVDAKYVIPMHLWQQYDLIKKYKELPETEDYRERVLEVAKENQVFEL